MKKREGEASGTNRLLDHLIESQRLKNDAALSRLLDVAPPMISKLRHGSLPLGATIIVRIHEVTDIPVREIKTMAGLYPTDAVGDAGSEGR